MSLIPAFEIGLWNAWIFILPFLLINYGLASLIAKESALFIWPQYNKKEKNFLAILMGTIFASFIYSIFLPLKLSIVWFYVGLFIYWVGMIFLTIAVINFATTPVDKPVTRGVFRISRNPMYVGWFLIYIGIGIACGSWIFLLIAIVFIILQHILVITEERMCLEKFGDEYREYMNKTPKWIGIPKSEKK
ncbi:MAG TPA: isoprenylcysteine carboxylmethyltransferase family protein [Thermoplasmatales archaeon]|nr:isoprenylcysteine carboxylmethyltransferase family protein [Thermoplasmatales archaeon]